MKLEHILLERKSDILEKWFDVILKTYPSESSDFFRTSQNQFTNPIGNTIFNGITELFAGLLDGIDPDKAEEPAKFSSILDSIIRIMAVQDFTASQAVAFIPLLKKVIREKIGKEIRENGIEEELSAFESKIDDLMLLSFDIFMKCREKIYELKSNEVKNMTFRLLQRANMVKVNDS